MKNTCYIHLANERAYNMKFKVGQRVRHVSKGFGVIVRKATEVDWIILCDKPTGSGTGHYQSGCSYKENHMWGALETFLKPVDSNLI